jgi:hypothetical protein
MAMRAADDFEAIRKAMKAETAPPQDPDPAPCARCEGGGWECYGLGHHDPHFRICEDCGNPEGLPCP